MIPRLGSAEYVKDYTIRVRFADGTAGDVDLTFRQFRIDAELDTVTWPSGADLAPEFLYEKASQQVDAGGGPFRGRR